MRFAMPNFPCDFGIPDNWLTEAGMGGFHRTGSAFRSFEGALLVPLREIEFQSLKAWQQRL